MSVKLFGLKSCDSCRKAKKALEAAGLTVTLVDIRSDAVSKTDITRWGEAAGWETLLNTRSTTWRGLTESEKSNVDADKAMTLMNTHRALIKRPVLERDGEIFVSWSPAVQAAFLP